MPANDIFLEDLTSEEKQIYDNLFVIRQESDELLKIFRMRYNTLKSYVSRLENKYGKTKDYDRKSKDAPNQSVIRGIFRIEKKYSHIEYNLWHFKERRKRFTKLVNSFPFDIIKYKGSTRKRLDELHTCITAAKNDIGGAIDDVRIANNYLKDITDYLERHNLKN